MRSNGRWRAEPGRHPGAAVARRASVGEQVLLKVGHSYDERISPRLRSAGDSASAISVMLRRVTGLAIRKPSPPASSMTSSICAATESGVPTSLTDSCTRWFAIASRSVGPERL